MDDACPRDLWMMGTAVRDGDALRIQLDCAASPLQKSVRIPQGLALREGSRVLLLEYGGAFLAVAVY